MALGARHILGSLGICAAVAGPAAAAPHPAIDAFVAYCFKAGQTAADAARSMADVAGTPLPFELRFWDKSLEPAPGTPDHVERRCAVTFVGDHAEAARTAVLAKMAEPPVFGTPIPLPDVVQPPTGDALMVEARALLRGRVAVVRIETLDDGARTRIQVDRLPAGMGLPE